MNFGVELHNITMKTNKADLCFNAINGSGPAYLSELLHVYTPSRTQRSSSDTRILNIQHDSWLSHFLLLCTPHLLTVFPPQLLSIPSFYYSQRERESLCVCVCVCVFVSREREAEVEAEA